MSQPNREEDLFDEALQLPEAARAGFLDKACAGDAALRRKIELLLRASDKAGGFLQQSPAAAKGHTIRIGLPGGERPGEKIGRYKLLQLIGEGGCGAVYMAEQEEPVRRRVAVKVIKLGMDTKQVIARFEAERQALALMEHPNIAKVLDAGTTELGRPFFVMELVRGIKITDYCDQNNLTTRQRLDLFIQVCHAIQHAHQKGIIHRDIKPSNILVTMHDGVPVPKVIDFGIAKATDQRLTDKTLFTAFEQFVGTPAYMSPEQAEMTALDIDTRSDIYALGVLLYELLTGQTPFDPTELAAAGLDAMRRTIREKEPPRPSTRLSTMMDADLVLAARHRQSDPDKLTGLIKGDLDWIVMKALEKDRTRRYETANGLSMDVQRYLNNEPIVARPPSRMYQFQKLARRHRGVFAAGAIVLAALLLGLAVSMCLLVREKEARRVAESAEKNANTAAIESDHVAAFLQDMLKGVGPEVAKGRKTDLLREILDATAEKMDTELQDQPKVQAKLTATVGRVYYDLGEYPKAEQMQRKAIDLAQHVFGPKSTNTATVLGAMARTLQEQGKLAEAGKMFDAALEAETNSLSEASIEVTATINEYGLLLWKRGDLDEAEARLRKALALREKFLHPDDSFVGEVRANLALVLWEQGKLDQAEQIIRDTLEIESKKGMQGENQDGHPMAERLELDMAMRNNLANVLLSKGKLPEAESAYRDALQVVEKMLPGDHPHVALVRSHLATASRRIAAATEDAAKLREALELDPSDPMTADGLACALTKPLLRPLASEAPKAWVYTHTEPAANWAAPDFSAADWQTAPSVAGFPTFSPRTDRAFPVLTNLWLRREFNAADLPTDTAALWVRRNQDAEVFLNGIPIAPTVDWGDTDVLIPCWTNGLKAAFKAGRNVLAIHCRDADGGAIIDAELYLTQDPTQGRQQLIGIFGEMIQREPKSAELYAGRASAFARIGRWKEAAADLTTAIELRPSDQTYWTQLAPLLVQTGDLAAYRLHRQKALDRFGDPSNSTVGEPVARLCLLSPSEGLALDAALKLADNAAQPGYANATLARRLWTEGLAQYRAGQFAGAVQSMNKAITAAARRDLPAWTHERERTLAAGAYLVKAMAYYQLNQRAEARAALNQGQEIIQSQFPQENGGDIGREWPDWLTAHIFLSEASQLVGGKL